MKEVKAEQTAPQMTQIQKPEPEAVIKEIIGYTEQFCVAKINQGTPLNKYEADGLLMRLWRIAGVLIEPQ